MPLEVASYIYGLNSNNPPNSDLVQQGDDHLRLIKQVIQQTWPNVTGPNLPTSGGSANAQTVTHLYAPTTYQPGQIVIFKAGFSNTGAMTINVNGAGAVPVYNSNVALTGGEVFANVNYMLIYDSSVNGFNILNLATVGGKVSGQLTAQTLIGTGSIQCNTPVSAAAWYYALVASVRQWLFGCNTNGYFEVLDGSAGAALRLYIDTSGNVVAPGPLLSNVNMQVNKSTAGAYYYAADNTREFHWGSNGGYWELFDDTAGGLLRDYIDSSGNLVHNYGTAYKPGGGSWAVTSDARIKSVAGEYTAGLDEVLKLKPIRYKYNGSYHVRRSEVSPHADTDTEYVGLIAQDLEAVFPDMVTKSTGYIGEYQVDDIRQADTSALVYALINAVKTLTVRIEALEAQLKEKANGVQE